MKIEDIQNTEESQNIFKNSKFANQGGIDYHHNCENWIYGF